MDDLISRQAALDAINSGMLTDDDTQFECPSECNSMLEWAVNAVKELPTAEPELSNNSPKVENENGDLISRQAAIEAMTECYWSIMGDEPPKLDEKTALYVDLKQAVKRLPTANPSVVTMKLNVDPEEVKKAMQNAVVTFFPADKKGKWIPNNVVNAVCPWCCSECNSNQTNRTPYCQMCGARMGE